MNKEEKIVEDIVMLLLKLKLEERINDYNYRWIASEAADMAYRVSKEWWEVPGKPHFNSRMRSIKRRLKK